MKYRTSLAIAGIILGLGSMCTRADIAYLISAQGTWGPGGAFFEGPWADLGFLYQGIWSDKIPDVSHVAGKGGVPLNRNGAQEFVLFMDFADHTYSGLPLNYGYIQFSDQPISLTQNTDGDVGGNDINNGYLYFRLFQTAAADIGDWYYQSMPTDTSTLTDTDVLNPPIPPRDYASISMTGGEAKEMDRQVVVPEPSPLSCLVLFGLMVALRNTLKH